MKILLRSHSTNNNLFNIVKFEYIKSILVDFKSFLFSTLSRISYFIVWYIDFIFVKCLLLFAKTNIVQII